MGAGERIRKLMNRMPFGDTYAGRMENYRNRYYAEGNENFYAPNGIKDMRTLVKKYAYLLALIKRDGAIIDFGCGNGLLLKFLVMNAPCRLIPFGVDFLKKSIRQAKTAVFPEYKENFVCGNIADYDFRGQHFDYILTNPDYLLESDWDTFYNRCMEHLSSMGLMILYIPPDDMERPRFARQMERFVASHEGFKRYEDDAIKIFSMEKCSALSAVGT